MSNRFDLESGDEDILRGGGGGGGGGGGEYSSSSTDSTTPFIKVHETEHIDASKGDQTNGKEIESTSSSRDDTRSKRKMIDSKHSLIKQIALIVLVVQGSGVALSMRYSRIPRDGVVQYRPTTAVLFSEVLKLIIAWTMVMIQEQNPIGHVKKYLVDEWKMTILVGIPAFLYTIQNNLLYFALTELDPSVYQVLYQIKLLTTAIFSTIILKRTISTTRWLSLGLLFIGVAIVNLAGQDEKNEADPTHVSLLGVLALFTAACLSGLAGVWFEKMLKGSPKVSIWTRNIQLGIFSLFFASVSVTIESAGGETRSFFDGYTPFVLFVVAQVAFGGLLVAMVIKYADNILKGFATSLSIILTSIMSYVIPSFHFTPSTTFIFGTGIVMLATYIYNTNPSSPFSLLVSKKEVAKPRDI